jgi:hypothetical protein
MMLRPTRNDPSPGVVNPEMTSLRRTLDGGIRVEAYPAEMTNRNGRMFAVSARIAVS